MTIYQHQIIPGISCSHTWAPQTAADRWTGKTYKTGRQECSACGAVCLRDKRGVIIEYSVPQADDERPRWMREHDHGSPGADRLARAIDLDDRITRPDLSS